MERAEAEAILDGDREAALVLLMQVGELVEANRRLEARVAELEQRLNRSSRNSSLPPSQDPPSAPPRPRQPGSGRSPGRPERTRGQEPAAASARAGGRGRRALAGALCSLLPSLRRGGAHRRGIPAAPPDRRAAADRGAGERAPPAPAALPRVRSGGARRAAGRSAPRRLRPAPAGGRRHA